MLQLQMSIEWTRALAMPISVVVASYIVGVHVNSAAGQLGDGIRDGLSTLMTVQKAGRNFMEEAFKEVKAELRHSAHAAHVHCRPFSPLCSPCSPCEH